MKMEKQNNDQEREIVCFCKNVTRGKILEALLNGAETLKQIQQVTGAGTGNKCHEKHPEKRCCHSDIAKIIGSTENKKDCC